MDYFLELYGSLPRAGPGDNASTRRALESMTHLPPAPRILDLGCGPGVQTIELLRRTAGTVVALDLYPQMLDRVQQAAEVARVGDRLEIVQADMHQMPFEPDSFDVIWSEGAIYFLGFQNGLALLHELVKPGGYVSVTEPVWLVSDPPQEAVEFWKEYPDIDSAAGKIKIVSQLGYELVDHFVLPAASWTEQYYDHLVKRVDLLQPRWTGVPEAEQVLNEARREVELFAQCSHAFSYAFFVMRRDTCNQTKRP